MDIVGVHEWRFADAEGGTTVETEESWSGGPIEADPAKMQVLLALPASNSNGRG